MTHLPPPDPKLHSSQMRTSVSGLTKESQIGLEVRGQVSLGQCQYRKYNIPFPVILLTKPTYGYTYIFQFQLHKP
jgi:hypothetical protein